jgi:uncharacterized membrane protein SpoIIM required for sporulation
MIINVEKFIREEKRNWEELEGMLRRMEQDPQYKADLTGLRRFHYLYQRASADLARVSTFAAEGEVRRYLESLVARAYGEIHENRGRAHRFAPFGWFFRTFPQTFRKCVAAYWLAVGLTVAGALFGAGAITLDYDSKAILMPFPSLQENPTDRVKREESAKSDRLVGQKTTFSALLMTHNTQVSIITLALGMTWGVGTILQLFYNGVIIGAISADYVMAGQTRFLLGWLMPHGVVEIPAILIAGQAGLVLARAMIGWGTRDAFKMRLRAIRSDLMTLIGGVAILLVWAGAIEAFLSQYHEPVIPYWVKITFGAVELILLTVFLATSGRKPSADPS